MLITEAQSLLAEIEEVYGRPFNELTAPEGYEFTGEFARPEDRPFLPAFPARYSASRVILRAKPKPRRWVFEEEPGVSLSNMDLFVDVLGRVKLWTGTYCNSRGYTRLRLVSKPEDAK